MASDELVVAEHEDAAQPLDYSVRESEESPAAARNPRGESVLDQLYAQRNKENDEQRLEQAAMGLARMRESGNNESAVASSLQNFLTMMKIQDQQQGGKISAVS